jgi:hypothetical protein
MKPATILRYGMRALALILFAFSAISWFTGPPDSIGVTMAMAFAFTDMTFDDYPESMGGFASVAYIGFIPEIATFPTRNLTPSSNDEAIKLLGSYAMKENKKFIEVYVTPETFGATAENQGEIDGRSFKIKGEIFYPGTEADCLALCRKINNARGVIIGINPNTGVRYNFGEQYLPVRFKPKVDFGKGPADRRGATIEWECDSFAPAWVYEGSIPLSAGTLPAVS